jgi:type VI secretion system FHA domain protein
MLPDNPVNPFVSREHVQVCNRAGTFYLKVVSKTNPIRINGANIPRNGEAEVANGDTIEIGLYGLIAELRDDAPAVAPAQGSPASDVFRVLASPLEPVMSPVRPQVPDPFASTNKHPADGPGLAPGSENAPLFIGVSGSGKAAPVPGNAAVDDFLGSGGGRPAPPASTVDPIYGRADHVDDINLPFGLPGRLDQPSGQPPGSMIFRVLQGGSPSPPPPARVERHEPAERPLPPRAQPAGPDLLARFAEGAGLRDLQLSPSEAGELMREIGRMVRSAVTGTHELLALRAEVKKELRAGERTMIASRENNPIKHTANGDEALRFMLENRNRNTAFLPPAQALANALDDIRAHEIAVMAGMRAGLKGVLRRFSPQQLEKRIKKTGALDRVVPSLYKAKLWDTYASLFGDIEGEADEHFEMLYSTEFVRAYEEQARKLKLGQ